MARIKGNNLTKGLSGKPGGSLVFQENGLVRTLPDTSKLKWSEAQKQHRRQFEYAREFARRVIANPELKAIYEAKATKGIGAYQVAISAYLRYPEVQKDPFCFPEIAGR